MRRRIARLHCYKAGGEAARHVATRHFGLGCSAGLRPRQHPLGPNAYFLYQPCDLNHPACTNLFATRHRGTLKPHPQAENKTEGLDRERLAKALAAAKQ